RREFAREWGRPGPAQPAAREYRLIPRVGPPASFYSGEALRRVAIDALARKDFLKAAEGHEQAMLRCLQPYIDFVNPSAYLGVPAYVHRLRAAGDFKAGKVEEALREGTLAQALLPARGGAPIPAGPAVERAGRETGSGGGLRETVRGLPHLRVGAQLGRVAGGVLPPQPGQGAGPRREGGEAGAGHRRPPGHAGRGPLPARPQGQGGGVAEESDKDGAEQG